MGVDSVRSGAPPSALVLDLANQFGVLGLNADHRHPPALIKGLQLAQKPKLAVAGRSVRRLRLIRRRTTGLLQKTSCAPVTEVSEPIRERSQRTFNVDPFAGGLAAAVRFHNLL